MMRLLEDLRFFIGAFFVIVGLLLAVAGLVQPEITAGVNLNLVVGITFVVFGGGALALAYCGLKKKI